MVHDVLNQYESLSKLKKYNQNNLISIKLKNHIISLKEVKNRINEFNDPRLVYALNDGSISSPDITVISARNIDKELTNCIINFYQNNSKGLKKEKNTFVLSKWPIMAGLDRQTSQKIIETYTSFKKIHTNTYMSYNYMLNGIH